LEGSQENPSFSISAVLMRVASRSHQHLRIERGDTVILSSSIVPGNELAVQGLKDILSKQGADVFHYRMLDIHSMLNLTKPRCFMPIHGNYSMLKAHTNIALSLGVNPLNAVIASNGQIVELGKNKIEATKKFVPANYILVDGLGVGDIGEIVLRDRQTLAKDGIFVIIATVDRKTGLLHNDPEIISRGFVYMKESKKLIDEVKKSTHEIISRSTKQQSFNESYIRNNLRDEIGLLLFSRLKKNTRF